MNIHVKTVLTLAVLAGMVGAGGAWGWSALTDPFPGKEDLGKCQMTALSAGDRAMLIDRAHKLAGIAGMFGRSDIGSAALELEQRVLADADFEDEAVRLLDLLDGP